MAPSDDKSDRQLAAEKLNGKGSNPSQLGDPISLKAETADSTPTNNDRGAASETSPQTMAQIPESSGGSHEEKMLKNAKPVRGMKTHHGSEQKSGGNKTMLGDPISLKSETSRYGSEEEDHGLSQEKQRKKDQSKL